MRNGRIFSVFTIDTRFGLPLLKPYVFECIGRMVAVTLLKEITALDFVDPTNSIEIVPAATPPFRFSKPIGVPGTEEIYMQQMSAGPEGAFDSQESMSAMLSRSLTLLVFDPLTTEASVRTRLSTRVVAAVECREADWQALGNELDATYPLIWDEFVKAYQRVTSDSRPPLWDENHRLVVIQQGWVPYSAADSEKDEIHRLQLPAEIGVHRFSVMSTYHREGLFNFELDDADKKLRQFFSTKKPVPLSSVILARAHRAVDTHRSGATAIIEATIALEIAVSRTLTEIKLQKGVAKRKLNDYAKEVGIGYQMNVEIPLLLGPLSDKEKEIIGIADAVRKQRNDVVHKGVQPSREEGQAAVAAVHAVLELLRLRQFDV
jgi:hypothetical protein